MPNVIANHNSHGGRMPLSSHIADTSVNIISINLFLCSKMIYLAFTLIVPHGKLVPSALYFSSQRTLIFCMHSRLFTKNQCQPQRKNWRIKFLTKKVSGHKLTVCNADCRYERDIYWRCQFYLCYENKPFLKTYVVLLMDLKQILLQPLIAYRPLIYYPMPVHLCLLMLSLCHRDILHHQHIRRYIEQRHIVNELPSLSRGQMQR